MKEKSYRELAVELTIAMLEHNSKVSQDINRTSVNGKTISAREVASAFLEIQHAVLTKDLLPESTKE